MVNDKKRSFVVIGLGILGCTIASALAEKEDDVLGVDIDEAVVSNNAERLSHTAILDARDELALREAGVGNYDVAIVTIGKNFEANIFATMNLKALGIKEIWVRAQSIIHHEILLQIGITRIIHPERDIGLQIAETLHTPYITDYINLGSGQYLVSIICEENMFPQGIIKFIEDNDAAACLFGIMHGEKFIDFNQMIDIKTEIGDRILAIGSKNQLNELIGLL